MTIIELNIAGLHVTRATPSAAAMKRLWHRSAATFGRNVKHAGWSATHLRTRPAEGRTAA